MQVALAHNSGVADDSSSATPGPDASILILASPRTPLRSVSPYPAAAGASPTPLNTARPVTESAVAEVIPSSAASIPAAAGTVVRRRAIAEEPTAAVGPDKGGTRLPPLSARLATGCGYCGDQRFY